MVVYGLALVSRDALRIEDRGDLAEALVGVPQEDESKDGGRKFRGLEARVRPQLVGRSPKAGFNRTRSDAILSSNCWSILAGFVHSRLPLMPATAWPHPDLGPMQSSLHAEVYRTVAVSRDIYQPSHLGIVDCPAIATLGIRHCPYAQTIDFTAEDDTR